MCLNIWRGNVEYQMGTEQNQNIISVFLNKKTVCQGYANATQYLLTLLGIPAVVVTGTAEETHTHGILSSLTVHIILWIRHGEILPITMVRAVWGLLSIIIISG